MIGIFPPNFLNPDKQTMPSLLVGSEIAGREFTKAMLRYLPARSVGLFVPRHSVETTEQELNRLQENEGGNYSAAHVYGKDTLPSVLRHEPVTAFHYVNAPQLHQLSYIRSQFAPRPFPITCLTHGFSQQYLSWDFFARLLLTPTLPCDSVICTSVAAQQAFLNNLERVRVGLQEVGAANLDTRCRVDVLPLGVDAELFRPRDQQDSRRLLGLPLNSTILLYFGRIDHAAKGDWYPLLVAFREVAAKCSERVVLVLAGAGSDAESNSIQQLTINMRLSDKVMLRRHPSVVEGPLYYAACDVFVSLSDTLQESFGVAPLEAMASGLPVVVTDWSGYRDTVIHGETGFRVTTRWAECDQDICALAR